MPQVSTFTTPVIPSRSDQWHSSVRGARSLKLIAGLLLVFLFSVATGAGAQVIDAAPPESGTQTSTDQTSAAPATNSATSENPEESSASSSTASGLGTTTSLSADQIMTILQQDPDVVIEVKSLVADRMQGQGVQVDANDI